MLKEKKILDKFNVLIDLLTIKLEIKYCACSSPILLLERSNVTI